MSYRQKVLSINTLQGVLDHAVSRVIRNRRPAFDFTLGACRYRTDRVGGHRSVCAVGSLILDKYTESIEGDNILATRVFRTLPDNIQAIPDVGRLLNDLQNAHDAPAKKWAEGDITRTEFISQFLNGVTQVARSYSLVPPATQQ